MDVRAFVKDSHQTVRAFVSDSHRKTVWALRKEPRQWRAPTQHYLDVVIVRVRDQRQETRALDGRCQLTLVLGLGTGHAARHDLAVLGEVLTQGVEILLVDLFDALGGELAELATTEELGHDSAP